MVRTFKATEISMKRRVWFAATGVLLLPACAAGPAPSSQPSGPEAACPGYADVATARIPDGRLLLQAFDSAARASAGNPRQTTVVTGRGPSAEDTATNRLLGVQVTASPHMDIPARHSFARQILEAYPPELRQARIGGSVLLVALVDTQGRVRETRIASSSGHRRMDDAAADVLRRARFEPAMAGDCRVPYLLRLPVGFIPQ